MVTDTYKKKKYQCRVTVKAGEKKKTVADHLVLNSGDVTLYYLSEEYKDYITYGSSHLREISFPGIRHKERSKGLGNIRGCGRLF